MYSIAICTATLCLQGENYPREYLFIFTDTQKDPQTENRQTNKQIPKPETDCQIFTHRPY